MRPPSCSTLATNALRSSALLLAFLCLVATTSAQTPVPGASTNMVSGTQWPGGDPFLQRQNEPSMAVSSRNPLHVVAGANDYRTVDLPFPNVGSAPVTGDAWLSFFTSYDGGSTWTSNLVPGYPQDTSTQGSTCPAKTKSSSTCSPIHGLNAGADPTVRGGTNGMFYYSGLAFDRDDSASSIFLARYIDDNNVEGTAPNPKTTYTQGTPGSTIRYLSTSVIASGTASNFFDKPTMAVDIPRFGAKTCVIPAGGKTTEQQSFSSGRIYVAFTQFIGPAANNVSQIMFSESDDCGVTWSTPFKISGSAQTNQGEAIAVDPNTGIVFVVWRVFDFNNKDKNAIQGVALLPGTSLFTPVVNVTPIQPFDQGTSDVSFRTNAYPAIAIDKNSYIYLAWSQRNGGTETAVSGGDARIEVLSAGFVVGSNGWPTLKLAGPTAVDDYAGRGHQIMPAMEYSAGKLTIAWYDFRDDGQYFSYTPSTVTPGTYTFVLEPDGQLYGTSLPAASTLSIPPYQPGYYIEDPAGPNYQTLRHTVDLRAAQALSGVPPKFTPSVMVSQYAYGTPLINPITETDEPDDNAPVEQLEFDAPNLPLFAQGTTPFVGDYIDVAGPTFVPSGTTWRYNNLPTDPDYTHVVWTDNRNVVPPSDGNWQNYTPVDLAPGAKSLYDGSTITTTCDAGHTGMRNQDIYTATLSQGVMMGALGNSKQLSSSIQRQFAVTVQNATTSPVSYQLSIPTQPSGGVASFLQFLQKGQAPVTTLDITIPALSSAATAVFITSSHATASVEVLAQQIDPNNGKLLTGGLTTSTVINPDSSNPPSADSGISTGETYNVVIGNPNAANPNAANPNAANPNAANPNAANSAIANPAVADPNAANPNAANPNAANPNAANPNAANQGVANPNAANPNAANPNAANATVANPNAANPNAANPNAANVSIANTALLDTNYVVTNTGNTTASYNVQFVQTQQIPSNVLTQVIVSGIYTTPTASACNLTLKANFVTLVSQTQPAFVAAGSKIPTTPTSNTPTFAIPPGGQALVTIRTYALGSATPFDPTTVITPVVASTAANSGTITPPISLTIVTTTLSSVTAGGTLSQTLQGIGGSGTGYKWSLTGSSNPSFVTLTPAGVLGGTVTSTLSGTVPITVEVTDSANNTASKTLTLVVIAPPQIQTTILNPAELGNSYNQPLSAAAGTPPYTWSVPNGLPSGLKLSTTSPSAAPIAIVGTPTTAAANTPVKINVTDANGAIASQTYSLQIYPQLTFPNTSLGNATSGTAFNPTLQVTGGSGQYTWVFQPNTPTYLATLSPGGALNYTPVGSGTVSFYVQVTDSANYIAYATFTLNVNPAPYFCLGACPSTTSTLTAAEEGASYSNSQLQLNGGTPPIVWSQTGLPGGLSMNSQSGVISGTPATETGGKTYTITVTAKDNDGAIAMYTVYLPVNIPLSIAPTRLNPGEQSVAYSQTLQPAGGTPPYVWSASNLSGSGLTLSSIGVLSGATPVPGTYTPTITVTDAFGKSVMITPTLTIAPPPAISPASLPMGFQNASYPQQQLVTTGGVGAPYNTFSYTPCPNTTLPSTGVSISNTGAISGVPTSPGSYCFTVSVTDALGQAASQNYNITVNATSLVGNTTGIPSLLGTGGFQMATTFSQGAAVWSTFKQSVAPGFSTTFTFQITPIPGETTADGIAFVIQNGTGSTPDGQGATGSGTSALGSIGGGIGYQGLPNSLAVEFDTYTNGSPMDDPNNNHIAIISDGVNPNSASHDSNSSEIPYPRLTVTNANPTLTIADGNVHTVVITYSGDSGSSGGTLSVSVDGVQQLSTTINTDLGDFLGLTAGNAWVGLTGATGGSRENTKVLSWSFTPTAPPTTY